MDGPGGKVLSPFSFGAGRGGSRGEDLGAV